MTFNGWKGDDLNVRVHMSSGPGQVPNQTGPPRPQQNGSALPQQMHSLAAGTAASAGGVGFRCFFSPETEMIRARTLIQERIYNVLLQRQRQRPPRNDDERRKFRNVAKRLEEGLLPLSSTREEYMNLETLESRLHGLIRRYQIDSQNQQQPQLVNSSSPVGAMIPTPGMSYGGNSTMVVASSVDTSIISASGTNSMPTGAGGIHGGSFYRSDGK